jgi:hypothetical protein
MSTYCKRHSKIETNLFCGKCGDPICPKCLVQTPVGARCPSCARLSRVPTYRVSAIYYLRAAGAGLGIALACGIAWGFLQTVLFSGFFSLLISAAVGFAIGEVISLSVNRKSGTGLAIIGALAVVVSYIIGNLTFWGWHFQLFDLLSVAVGVFVSVARLR